MKETIMVLIAGILLMGVNVFADDVSIDSDGNVETGVSNTSANFEVTGASAEDAIFGSASGTGAAGVYGINTDNNNYGILGFDNYGVYGNSVSGYAGYFDGDARVTGDLTVDGTFNALAPLAVSGSVTWGAVVSGINYEEFGYGVYGEVTGSGLYGGYFKSSSFTGRGVYGLSTGSNGTGVYGWASNGGTAGYFSSTTGYGLIVNSGNVGIGTTSPNQKLTVAGIIESTSGGIKFPDGTIQSSARYGGVAVVATSGGDYTDPLTAMGDIATWCGTPSATNPCMMKLMPGIYDLGNNGLAMQPYVDLEGSGENTTTITSTHSSGTWDANSATVSGADNMEIRFLTIENQGGNTYSIAIYNGNASPDITHVTAIASGGTYIYGVLNVSSSSPAMTHVTATASGGGSLNYAVLNVSSSSPAMTHVTAIASGWGDNKYGIGNLSSSPIMTNVTAIASGWGYSLNAGVYNDNFSAPVMTHVTATAEGGNNNFGLFNQYASSTIKTSSISGTTNSILNGSSSTVKVGASMLEGSVTGGGFTCVGVYDENFAALDTSCQPIP